MAKEIMEQPEAFRKTVFPRIQEGRVVLDELNLEPDYLRELDKLYVIACGSSYHVGMAAKYTLERLLRKPVEVTLASEFRYCDPIVTDKTLVLVISQSGETVDTLAALREAKRLGARLLSIVNVVGSTIARESDDVLYTWAGPEIAVATTKAFSTQLAVVYLIGLYCAEALGTLDEAEYDRIVSELLLIPTKLEQILDNRADIQYFASLYFNHPLSSSSAATSTTPSAWRAPSSSRRSLTSTRRPTRPASSSTAPSPSSSRAPWWWPWPAMSSSLTRP